MYKPVEQEAQQLRRYEPDTVLNSVSKASAWRRNDVQGFIKALEKEKLDYRVKLRDCQLAFVTKLVLHFCDKPRLSKRQFTWQDLVKASDALVKNQNPSSYRLNSLDDADKFFIRVAYQQFPDFYGDSDTFARTRLLFRDCAKYLETKKSFDINTAYKEATGLTFDQTWDITLALYELVLSQKGGIQPGPIRSLITGIMNNDINRFVSNISLTPTQFQAKMKLPEYTMDQFETFNPNPLVNWPIIILDSNRWVIPVLPYLFRRGTEQLFYDVIGTKGRKFASFFGYVFEEYTSRILSILEPACEIIPEIRYSRNGQTYDTCDRIIIKGGDAILIECKTKRLKLKTKFTADENLLRDDLTDIKITEDKGSVVSGIRQLYRTEQDIRANCPGLESLNRKISGRIYPIVLVLDPYYLANSLYIKRIIKEELEKGDTPIKDYDWQIIDARGFEILCSLARQDDLLRLVAQKFSSPELQIQDMETFVYNYAEHQKISRATLDHPYHSLQLDALRKEIKLRHKL